MSNQFSLEGKVAVVTGSGRGLGKGIAVALAAAGADIIGVVNTSRSTETQEAVEASGRSYYELQEDLSLPGAPASVITRAAAINGHVDILVNNSGIIKRNDSLEFTEEEWDLVVDLNLKSVFFLCQAFARQVLKQGTPGKIINIASMLSYQGGVRVPSYTAAKSGVRGITMTLANEWAGKGINVNAIAPGYMATDNTESLRDNPQRAAGILARIPAGRWGTPEDLGGAAVFLASRASDYVNGFTIAVDGGWLAR